MRSARRFAARPSSTRRSALWRAMCTKIAAVRRLFASAVFATCWSTPWHSIAICRFSGVIGTDTTPSHSVAREAAFFFPDFLFTRRVEACSSSDASSSDAPFS